jgi:hypothetical protein
MHLRRRGFNMFVVDVCTTPSLNVKKCDKEILIQVCVEEILDEKSRYILRPMNKFSSWMSRNKKSVVSKFRKMQTLETFRIKLKVPFRDVL